MLVQIILSGLFMGFIYALISLGLSLIYGVMGITNFANGDFLTLAMYLAFLFSISLGADPLVSMPLVALLMAAFGTVVYWLIIRHVLRGTKVAQIFVTFGMMIFIRGILQFIFTANYRTIQNPILEGSVRILGASISKPQAVAAAVALVAASAVYLFLNKTRIGWALQAVSENKDAASLMGIPSQRMYILAWAIGGACSGIAGCLLSEYYYIYPEVGSVFGNLCVIIVALGGFGSISGVFLAGLLVGMVEVVCGYYISTAYKYVFVYVLYFIFMAVRPQGIMGKKGA